ncbi:MAG TPA: polysaccharide biosynthesis/export family protein [Candidatus Binatus sp.]|nr:polysaccharide biosynthesis/export family protein [Candidatus Binatus sp.]
MRKKIGARKSIKKTLLAAMVSFCVMVPLAKAQSGSSTGDKQTTTPPASSTPPSAALSTKPAAAGSPKPANSNREGLRADDPSLNGYTIGEQDVLDIDVWREKELSGPVVVRPDGKITVPLVNEFYVIGLTPLQLEAALTEKLQPFVTAAQVTVTVREINSRKVYVIGQVVHEGVFKINSTTTVSQIIVQAGGLREFAKRKKIYVLRTVNGKHIRLPFNYDAVIKGQANGQDVVVKPDDKIIVP